MLTVRTSDISLFAGFQETSPPKVLKESGNTYDNYSPHKSGELLDGVNKRQLGHCLLNVLDSTHVIFASAIHSWPIRCVVDGACLPKFEFQAR